MTQGSPPTIEEVITTYIKLREKKEAIDAEVKERLAGIHEKMGKIEAWIQVKADEQGVKSFKTDAGTAFLATRDFASVGDWDVVLAWVQEKEAWDLLTKGVSKTAVRAYIDADGVVPNGVNFGTGITVSVRRPAKKG